MDIIATNVNKNVIFIYGDPYPAALNLIQYHSLAPVIYYANKIWSPVLLI